MYSLLPPVPPWEGLHPIVVHLPIGILLAVPLLIILGLFCKAHSRGFFYSAMVLMIVGTMGAYLAYFSGEATAQVAERPEDAMTDTVKMDTINKAIENHAESAEKVLIAFTLLSIIYVVMLYLPMIMGKMLTPQWIWGMQIFFLLLYGIGCLILAKTGHLGGVLVHYYGLKAPLNM